MNLLLVITSLLMSFSARAVEPDAKERSLSGTWVFTSASAKKSFGYKLKIEADLGIWHSSLGEGDIRRESGDRYKVTFYSGPECHVLIRNLGAQDMIVTGFSGALACIEPIEGNVKRTLSERPAESNQTPTSAPEVRRSYGDGSTPIQDVGIAR